MKQGNKESAVLIDLVNRRAVVFPETTLTIEPYLHRKMRKLIKRTPKRAKLASKGILTLVKADALFSRQIRARDKFCQFKECLISDPAKLQNSHYFGRAIKSTRFDPDNCVALCWLHHFKDKLLGYEYQKQTFEKHGYDGQYTLFMKERLGEKRFNFLREKSHLSMKQKTAIALFQESLPKT